MKNVEPENRGPWAQQPFKAYNTQVAFTCSKLTIETLAQSVEYVQSQQ